MRLWICLLLGLSCCVASGQGKTKLTPWFRWNDKYSSDHLLAARYLTGADEIGIRIDAKFGTRKIHIEIGDEYPHSSSVVQIDNWTDHPATLFLIQTEHGTGRGGQLYAFFVRDHKLIGSYEFLACPVETA